MWHDKEIYCRIGDVGEIRGTGPHEARILRQCTGFQPIRPPRESIDWRCHAVTQ